MLCLTQITKKPNFSGPEHANAAKLIIIIKSIGVKSTQYREHSHK